MKLVILAAGKLRDAWVRDACDEYGKRIARHLPFEIVEVNPLLDQSNITVELACELILSALGKTIL